MYTTLPNLKTRYPRLESANANSSTLIRWVNYADGIIDGYVGQVLTLPMSDTPPLIQGLSEDLAYSMFMQRHSRESDKEGTYNSIERKAIEILKSIAKGEMMLVSSGGANLSSSMDTAISNTTGYVPTFNLRSPENWKVDHNYLDDLEDEQDTT